MKNAAKEHIPTGVERKNYKEIYMRTLITALFMISSMVLTGCSYLQQPAAPTKQAAGCFDQGRSGYWCPDTTRAVATDASSKKTAETLD